jgi:hypothetical protein
VVTDAITTATDGAWSLVLQTCHSGTPNYTTASGYTNLWTLASPEALVQYDEITTATTVGPITDATATDRGWISGHIALRPAGAGGDVTLSGGPTIPAASTSGNTDVDLALTGGLTIGAHTTSGTVDVDIALSGTVTFAGPVTAGTVDVDLALSGGPTVAGLTTAGTVDVDLALTGGPTIPAPGTSGNISTAADRTLSGGFTIPGVSTSGNLSILTAALSGGFTLAGIATFGQLTVTERRMYLKQSDSASMALLPDDMRIFDATVIEDDTLLGRAKRYLKQTTAATMRLK